MDGIPRKRLEQFLKLALAKAEGRAGHDGFAQEMLRGWQTAVYDHALPPEDEKLLRFHLFFSRSEAGAAKVFLSRSGERRNNVVLSFNDIFSLGPLWRNEEEGLRNRWEWFAQRYVQRQDFDFHGEFAIPGMADKLRRLPAEKPLVIWCADNSHDQTGLRFVLHVLSDWEGDVHVVNVSEAYSQLASSAREDSPYACGILEPEEWTELLRYSKETRPLSMEARKAYEREWEILAESKAVLRIWENGRIAEVPESYFDGKLLAVIEELQAKEEDEGFVRAGAAVGEAFRRWRQAISDSFLDYRLWTMIGEGRLHYRGLPGELFKYAVRIPSR